jgi:hypothetical protein
MYGIFKQIVKIDCTKSIVIKCKLYRFKGRFGTSMTTAAVLLIDAMKIESILKVPMGLIYDSILLNSHDVNLYKNDQYLPKLCKSMINRGEET